MSYNKEFLLIGGLVVAVKFVDEGSGLNLIPSFRNFRCQMFNDEHKADIMVEVGKYDLNDDYADTYTADVPNATVKIKKLTDAYNFYVYNTDDILCSKFCANIDFTSCRCQLYGHDDEKSFGLNTAMLIIYTYASSFKGRLVLHSSVIKNNGRAYCFIGKSGDGKSTQSSLWVNNIPGSSILNDDNPIMEVTKEGKTIIWGSPWSGKTDYYINDSAELCAMVKVSHGIENNIKKVDGLSSLADLISSASACSLKDEAFRCAVDSMCRALCIYPLYEMSCRPEKQAALLCYSTITKHQDAADV